MSACGEPACERPAVARGFCKKHYRQRRADGRLALLERVTPPCSIDGCERPSRRRGWCHTHYERWRKHGRTELSARPSREDRFWAKVQKTETCWLWTAAKNGPGYGQFGLGTREDGLVFAHRFAYELVVGPIPEGLVIDHLCRTPACVRPDHLEPVTMRENMRRGDCPWAKKSRSA